MKKLRNAIYSMQTRTSFYNCEKTIYLDGSEKIKKVSFLISSQNGRFADNIKNGSSTEDELLRYRNRSLNKVRQSIIDLSYNNGCCNNWHYFITLTFNPNKIDRYDYDICVSKIQNYLSVLRRNNHNLEYIIVPERHKDGAFHFHGLLKNVDLKLIDSGKREKDNTIIYNCGNYSWGFTTVSIVKDYEKVSHYIAKYISKDIINIRNRRRYWYSSNLLKPNITKHNIDDDELNDYLSNSLIKHNKTLEKNNFKISYINLIPTKQNFT